SEMTAAHNKLPIGTLVRVTHLANGKSVTVRITDRGIHDRRVKIDVCKEAATELGMLEKGIARVRLEVVPEGSGASESKTAADK
ncbi:MAG: septal ring lytic transglycosylase RlpA family protein, partial [Verrucomicrobiota bacterium]|nr:septal ring lytic transglycosylase RlpA family protein [Verrucomicrobiota bacterium]